MKIFGFNITRVDHKEEAERQRLIRIGCEAVLFRPEVFTAFLAGENARKRKFRGKRKSLRSKGIPA